MMMKHHNQQQQQQHHSMNGVHGGPSSTETKWWYKGPDGETYGPYTPREMSTWGNSGYFNDSLPVKTEKDEMFHPIGDWTTVMGGANPFASGSVPAFHVLVHGAQQQYMMYPPGLPAPAPFTSGVAPPPSGGGGRGGPDGRYGAPPQSFVPNGGPPPPTAAAAAAMANLHLGGGGGHMGMHHIHHGGPLSQPPSEPNDGANSSNSHTPDSAEPDFRALHQMGGMPPPVPPMHAGRMQFGYGMPPMQQAQVAAQHQQLAAAAAAAAAAASQTPNGQMQYSRLTTTADAPWNSRRDMAVDASQRAAPRTTIATQTLPVIIGSKDASRLLSELTGCQIVIT